MSPRVSTISWACFALSLFQATSAFISPQASSFHPIRSLHTVSSQRRPKLALSGHPLLLSSTRRSILVGFDGIIAPVSMGMGGDGIGAGHACVGQPKSLFRSRKSFLGGMYQAKGVARLLTSSAADAADGGEFEVAKNTRDDMHFERKLFHIVGGLFFVVARLNSTRLLFVSVLGAVGLTTVAFEILRIRSSRVNKFFFDILGPVMRQHESDHFSGMAYYMLGVTGASALFHETLAVIGILALTIGDPTASFCGQGARKVLRPDSMAARFFSKKLLFGKSVAGTMGFFASAAMLIAVCLSAAGASLTGSATLLALVLAPAAMGAFVELVIPSPQLCLPFRSFPLGIDDNLLLPVCSALASHLAWVAVGSPPLPVFRRFILFG